MEYVLVTGAYGGMGRAVAQALKNAGYFVFALDKNVEEAEDNIISAVYVTSGSTSKFASIGSFFSKTKSTLTSAISDYLWFCI